MIAGTIIAAAPQTSSVTDATERYADDYRITTITWLADSTGAVTTTTSTMKFRGIIDKFITIPDTSTTPAVEDSSGRAPTDNYDITLTTVGSGWTNPAGGIEIAGNALSNRDQSNIESTLPRFVIQGVAGDLDTIPLPIFIDSKISTAISGNSTPNATGRIKIFWRAK